MRWLNSSDFLVDSFFPGWHRWAAFSIGVGAVLLLGALRTETDAEFAFASLALLPVLAIAWVGGKRDGLLLALLAAVMWAVSDITSERQFSSTWIPWVNAITRLLTYSLVVLLAVQVRQQLERLHELATRDGLTGLINRSTFLRIGGRAVERSKRYGHSLAVVFLDLDNFKQLNDSQGHDAGDEALRMTAEAMRGVLRANDQIARLGGDEFAVLLPEIDHDAAIEAGNKILSAVNDALRANSSVQASIGVAWFDEADCTFSEMLKVADHLMYEVKRSGKGNLRSLRPVHRVELQR